MRRAASGTAARVRAARAAAVVLVTAQVASTLVLGSSRGGVASTNLILLVTVVATALAATSAARRALGFARRFWALVASSLWVWVAAQAHYSYQEIWLGISATQPSLAHLLYRLSGAPLVMALLLRDEELPAIDWQRVLDFAQVGILFLFFYFDLYFVPGSGWRGLVDLNLAGFIDLSDIENWLLAAGFVLRARLARSGATRRLAARWAPFLVAYALTSSFYNYTSTFLSFTTGDWDEGPWVVTFGIGLLLASSWQPAPDGETERAEATSPPGAFGSDWLPALIPLATLALALQVAPHDPPVAFAAVFGSIVCFGARLVVTQSRQERAIEELRASERRQRQLVLELEANNAELERFTYTVSHDLRSPLITIFGFLGFVEREVAGRETERVLADLGRVRAAATRMDRLLRELLDMSRIGRATAPTQEVALEALAREVVASAQPAIAAGGVELSVEPGLPAVSGDPVRLRQALQNLVDNAVKFTAGRPQARVTIGAAGVDGSGMRVLFVRDNGIGIDPRHHERVFGLFEKLDPAREGTGVGLAIVKRVVELHGGRVWVESAAGQGSTFWFTLPGAKAAATS